MLEKFFKNSDNYKFTEEKNTMCIVCCHIFNKNGPILYVTHDEDDGMWQFLCGHENHTTEDIKIIALSEAVEIDSSINELYEMPEDIGAMKESKNKEWEFFKMN